MKILFACPFINNAHFMKPVIMQLKKNLVDCKYDFIVLNDAPDIDNGDENYLGVISILNQNEKCYNEIFEESKNLDLKHIKIPQNVHIKDRPNHGSLRYGELLNWFLKNIDTLYSDIVDYDYLCIYDADLFLINKIDLQIELENCDFACPIIHLNVKYNGDVYTQVPQPSIFFINLKTVKNFRQLDFGINPNIMNDNGSMISFFWKNNPQYKIKEIGTFDGFHNDSYNKEGKTIKQIDGHFYDSWFNDKFVHLRWGWGGGSGQKKNRNDKNLYNYIFKINKVFEKYYIDFDFNRWIK